MAASLVTVRWVLKPLVWLACLAPFALIAAGAFGVAGVDLGANPIDEIVDRLGKTALNLLLLGLCVTPLAELSGWRDALRFRRLLGLFAFAYALAHFAMYLIVDQTLDWGYIVDDIVRRPYITIGFTALVLLVPLVVTSTQRAMRRLGRRWQKLHRLVYVIAALACVHYYWQVKADIREPLLYFAGLAVLLGWRYWYRRTRRAAARAREAASAATG